MDLFEEFIRTVQERWPPPAKYEPHLLTGQLAPDSGSVQLGTNLKMMLLDQARAVLDPMMTVTEVLTGGRYIDRYVKRGGKWLILSRTFVADWSHSHPSTMERDGFYEALTNRGCFGTTDPVYAHWAA